MFGTFWEPSVIAVPAGGFWEGVKYGAFGAASLLRVAEAISDNE